MAPPSSVPDDNTSTTNSPYKSAAVTKVVGPLMMDLAVQALRCGRTNVVSAFFGDYLTPWNDAQPGDADYIQYDNGHAMGHRTSAIGGAAASERDRWLLKFTRNRQDKAANIARFVRGLKETDLGGGRSLLDDALILWCTNFSNADAHSHYRLTWSLIGGAGGLVGNRHLHFNKAAGAATNPFVGEYSSDLTTRHVLTSCAKLCGLETLRFDGVDAGPVPGL